MEFLGQKGCGCGMVWTMIFSCKFCSKLWTTLPSMHLCSITTLTHFDAVDFECTQRGVILSISWSPQIWCSFSGENSLFETFLLGWSVRFGGRRSMPGSCRSSLAMRHPKMKDYDEDACDGRYRWLFAGWTFCLAICMTTMILSKRRGRPVLDLFGGWQFDGDAPFPKWLCPLEDDDERFNLAVLDMTKDFVSGYGSRCGITLTHWSWLTLVFPGSFQKRKVFRAVLNTSLLHNLGCLNIPHVQEMIWNNMKFTLVRSPRFPPTSTTKFFVACKNPCWGVSQKGGWRASWGRQSRGWSWSWEGCE